MEESGGKLLVEAYINDYLVVESFHEGLTGRYALPGGMLFKQFAGKLVIKTPENIY